MKKFMLVLTLALLNSSVFASGSTTTCSNAAGDIVFSSGYDAKVTIISKRPTYGSPEEESSSYSFSDIDIELIEMIELKDDTTRYCHSDRSLQTRKIKLIEDGEKLPNAYTQNANADGSITDVFLCETTSCSSPR